MPLIYTIGHSTRQMEKFLNMLKCNCVTSLIDIRMLPGSRHNPQFNRESLQKAAEGEGIKYEHVKALGGLRKPLEDSINLVEKCQLQGLRRLYAKRRV